MTKKYQFFAMLSLALLLSGCSHKVHPSSTSTSVIDTHSTSSVSNISSVQSISGTNNTIERVTGNNMVISQTNNSGHDKNGSAIISQSVRTGYIMVVKAGSNTSTMSLGNGTKFNVYSNGVHINGEMRNGYLNLQVGAKHIQLHGDELRHYNFKDSKVSLSIR